ncbi:carbohydrate kinase [Thauera sp.]|uniref:carbohydrate kinase family protein n=1 Tax=Thauera sp. TaxID=1905334 RepID=UPI002590695C|nr:carbohydrate kinase [Thauera sp.]
MFIVCGEALFDVFIGAESGRSLHLETHPGGSPFNVAIGLARLGQSVSFLGGVARDMLGDRLHKVLEAEGVGTATVQRFDAPTTLGMVEVAADGVPRYAFYGNGAADRLLTAEALPVLDEAVRAIHLGSFATVVEPVASALEALIRRERDRRLIAYDPNIRLNVEPSVERWQDKVETVAGLAHFVKISDEDAHLLYAGTADDTLAERWLAAGAKLVVMTRGGAGASAWNATGRVDIAAPRVSVIDTVGAGDTFQAASLTWLAENEFLNADSLAGLDADRVGALLRFAAQSAAITCSRRGADLPRRAEVGAT